MSEINHRNKLIIQEFRANEGKVGGRFEGKSLLLLHTQGAKSGEERINPVACVKDDDRLVVIPSKGGAPTNPNWYYNVLAHPLVTVEVGADKFQAQAKIAEEPERTRLYNKMVEMMPGFDDYKEKNHTYDSRHCADTCEIRSTCPNKNGLVDALSETVFVLGTTYPLSSPAVDLIPRLHIQSRLKVGQSAFAKHPLGQRTSYEWP